MLKKAGTVVAIATAGMLVLNPLAYAGGDDDDDDRQSNSQRSSQGNGAFNGNNVGSGNSTQVCNLNLNAFNNVFGSIGNGNSRQRSRVVQGGGACTSNSVVVGQNTSQNAKNRNDD